MAISRLPLDIKELLTKHFDSVFQLEILFLFHENPDREMSAVEVCRLLRNSISVTQVQLDKLTTEGFLKSIPPDKFILIPSESIDKLHLAYQERPVAVIAFLYERPNENLKSFADAFKLKKD